MLNKELLNLFSKIIKVQNYVRNGRRDPLLFNSLQKLRATHIRLSLEPSSYAFLLLKKGTPTKLNVNTQIHNLSVPFSASTAKIVACDSATVYSKSLRNGFRIEHTWPEREASLEKTKVGLPRASKTGHSVHAESHRRFLGVDSLLIHHETKRNYFTRARKRGGLAGTVVRALSRRHFAGA